VSLRLCVEFCLLIFNALHFFYLGGAKGQRRKEKKSFSFASLPLSTFALNLLPAKRYFKRLFSVVISIIKKTLFIWLITVELLLEIEAC
jgi:hypothetical protein